VHEPQTHTSQQEQQREPSAVAFVKQMVQQARRHGEHRCALLCAISCWHMQQRRGQGHKLLQEASNYKSMPDIQRLKRPHKRGYHQTIIRTLSAGSSQSAAITDNGPETRALLRWIAKPQAGGGSGREHASWHSERAKNKGCGCTAHL